MEPILLDEILYVRERRHSPSLCMLLQREMSDTSGEIFDCLFSAQGEASFLQPPRKILGSHPTNFFLPEKKEKCTLLITHCGAWKNCRSPNLEFGAI